MWGMHDDAGWWMVLMPVSWALFFAFIVYLIARTSRPGSDRSETPREIAKRRYAAGEIGAEELKRILENLEK